MCYKLINLENIILCFFYSRTSTILSVAIVSQTLCIPLFLIANVLGNHQQEKWIMRRRSQYELDTLFKEHGFTKKHMFIDNWGIFTVSSAKYSKE